MFKIEMCYLYISELFTGNIGVEGKTFEPFNSDCLAQGKYRNKVSNNND